MALNGRDGIIVRPSNPDRRSAIPIPLVHGITVSSVPITDVVISVDDPLVSPIDTVVRDVIEEIITLPEVDEEGQSVDVTPKQKFIANAGEPDEEEIEVDLVLERIPAVLHFNLADYITIENAEPPYNIRIERVEEITDSRVAKPWSEENRFLTVNENGVITYKPNGLYLWNSLDIDFVLEAGDDRPNELQGERSGISQRREPRRQDNPYLDDGETGTEEGDTENVAGAPSLNISNIRIEIDGNGIIGNPEALAKLHENQGSDGVCQLATLQIALDNLRLSDPVTWASIPEDVTLDYLISLTTLRVIRDENGNFLRYADPTPDAQGVITTEKGNPLYGIETKTTPSGKTYDKIGRPTLTGFGNTIVALEHFGAPHYVAQSMGVLTIMKALERGDTVIAAVDSSELWSNPVMNDINQAAEGEPTYPIGNVNYGANHVVVISGIDLRDPANPRIIVNDSSRTGFDSYDMVDFLNAFADGNSILLGVGNENPPDITRQEDAHQLYSDMKEGGGNRLAWRVTRENEAPLAHKNLIGFLEAAGSSIGPIIDHMEDNGFPDFGDRLNAFFHGYQNDLYTTLKAMGVPDEVIEKIRTADRDARLDK